MAGEIAHAFVRISPVTTGFQSSLERQTSGVGKSIGGKIGKAMGLAIGGTVAAAAGGLGAAVDLAIGFDKSMRNVNSIAKLNEKSFQALNKRVLDLGKTAGVAPKTLADGLYDVVSSGFAANDAMKILTAGALAGKAGLTDTATATGAVTAVLNAYHMSADSAGKVSDALFQTVNVGVVNFEQLASTIGDVLPFASTLGVNIQAVGGAIATMTKEGINASETVTRIKAVMTQFISPSKDLTKAIHDQGFESGAAMIKALGLQGSLDRLYKSTGGNITQMGKLFPDVRALGGALALTGKNSKGANADLIALAKSQGATASAAKEQAKSISQQW
ncbi:MAG TPA: phage tail tape measure protein, partial [Gemmatimonadales bacterium]|nr:phage tail tape measure protein [Gemmatimonadales bacterium]